MVRHRQKPLLKMKEQKLTTPLSAHQKSYGPPFSSSKKSHDPPQYSTVPGRNNERSLKECAIELLKI